MYRILRQDCSKINLVNIAVVERIVRRWWLVSLFVYTGFLVCFLGVLLINEFSAGSPIEFRKIIRLLPLLYGAFLFALLPYVFSYKGKGTAYLKYTMIMLPLQELAALANGGWSGAATLSIPVILIAVETKLFYWIACWRLHKINVNYKRYRRLLSFRAR